MSLNERRVLIRKIVDAVGFHKCGDAVGGTYYAVSWPTPFWLPRESKPRLEVVNALVRVVRESDLRSSGDAIKVHILAIAGAVCRRQFIMHAEAPSPVVCDAPVRLS